MAACLGIVWLALVSVLSAARDVPILFVAARKVDLGEGSPAEVVEGSLRLENRGTVDLEFSIQGTCSCAHIRPDHGSIQPDGAVSVRVGVKLAPYGESEKTVNLTILSNDPNVPRTTCRLTARCPSPVAVVPRRIHMVVAKTGPAPAFPELVVTCKSKDDANRLELSHQADWLELSQTCSGKEWRVRLSTTAKVAEGDWYDTIRVSLTEDPRVLLVPVHLRVEPLLSVVPSTIYPRANADGIEVEPLDVIVIARQVARVGSEPSLVVRNSETGWAVQMLEQKQGRHARCRLSFNRPIDELKDTELTLVDMTTGEQCSVSIVVQSTSGGD